MATVYETAELALPNMVAWWKLNDSSANFIDSSGNGITLTASGTGTVYQKPSLLAGDPTNTCLLFNGSGYGTHATSSSLNLTNGFTFSCWCQPTQASAQAFIVGKFGGYSFGLAPSGVFGSAVSGGSSANTPAFTGVSSNTYFLVGTYDLHNVKTYVNGVLLATTARTATVPTSSNPLEVARDLTNNWQGYLQHVVIRSGAISISDLQGLYVIGAKGANETAGLSAQAYPFSRVVLASNGSAARRRFWNTSDHGIYLGLGQAAVIGGGPFLRPRRGYFETTTFTGDVYAIHDGYLGSKTLTLLEE